MKKINLIMRPLDNPYAHSLILKQLDNHQRKVIGVIKHHQNQVGHALFGVQWLEDISTLTDDTILYISDLNNGSHKTFNGYSARVAMTISHNAIWTGTTELSNQNYLNILLSANTKNVCSLVPDELFDKYSMCYTASQQITHLCDAYPVYRHIVTFDEQQKPHLNSLADMICLLPSKDIDDTLMAFSYANKQILTLKNLAENVLTKVKITTGQDLMTQEQQVESFIQFSKLVANNTKELVTDDLLNAMKQSSEYAQVVSALKQHGFGLSKTQQFNVLQAAAYLLLSSVTPIIYNLSDMGAGKTLMTVESIYLMDLKSISDITQEDDYVSTIQDVHEMYLPNKNLIAPTLSVKSSWIETFKLFYDVKEINESQYELTCVSNGITYHSKLNVCAFTARANAISVNNSLPSCHSGKEYLIIDEIHQLVKRKITRRRFFARDIVPRYNYVSFVLSGTLSNLTTMEWYNYAQWMGIKFHDTDLDDHSAHEITNDIDAIKTDLAQQIAQSADTITSEQHRYFDDNIEQQTPLAINPPKLSTHKVELFHLKYSSKIIDLYTSNGTLQHKLINKSFNVNFDFNLSMTPNFELFYQIVGQSAITAQSSQIAEELFGEQKTQHNADVINVPSSLTSDDIKLLRVLHQITADYQIYKSASIATAINNAILNLNDGLNTKNIYDILGHYAKTNIRFFQYLSTLQLDVLEKLPQSQLIEQPELIETPKFKVLQDLLHKEPDATFLIVVNDYGAMTKLGKALHIETFTRTQLRNQLDYQDELDEMFTKQNIVIVPQAMIKSSLDLIQANRLIQYQLNTEIADIIQTQNRINRIGQKRETKAYYIATDVLQKNIISLFLETYKNIRVAHKGIVELFVDMSSQVNVINDYIAKAFSNINDDDVPNNVIATQPLLDSTASDNIEDVQIAAFKPTFNPNGEMTLFGDGDDDINAAIEAPETEPIKDSNVFIDTTNPNQQNLFASIDYALEHQLVPLC